MAYSQFRKYKSADLSTATISLKVFEDEEHGLHSVILSLPAGMDIAPDVWRFERQGDAENKFHKVCSQIEAKGFTCVQTGQL
jgi:hypothetical protein